MTKESFQEEGSTNPNSRNSSLILNSSPISDSPSSSSSAATPTDSDSVPIGDDPSSSSSSAGTPTDSDSVPIGDDPSSSSSSAGTPTDSDSVPIGDDPSSSSSSTTTPTVSDSIPIGQPPVRANFLDLPLCLIERILSKLPTNEAASIPFVSTAMLEVFFQDPYHIDKSMVSSWIPLCLQIDCESLKTSLDNDTWLEYSEYTYWVGLFVKGVVGFYRESINELSLKGCHMKLSKPFAALRIVRLSRVLLHSIEGLIQNLPVLEELYLVDSTVPMWFSINAETSCLRCLVIVGCGGHIEGVVQNPFFPLSQIYIRLPRLVRFMFVGTVTNAFDVIAKQLLEASVGFTVFEYGFIEEQPVVHKLLLSLRSVNKLNICSLCLQNIRELNNRDCLQQLKRLFTHLEELTVETAIGKGVAELGSLLISVPNIRRLCIEISSSSPSEAFENHHLDDVSTTFGSLVYFQLTSFTGFGNELQLLSFLLRNSPSLLKAKIVMTSIDPSQLDHKMVQEASKKYISDIPKASKVVEIEMVEE